MLRYRRLDRGISPETLGVLRAVYGACGPYLSVSLILLIGHRIGACLLHPRPAKKRHFERLQYSHCRPPGIFSDRSTSESARRCATSVRGAASVMSLPT